MSDAVVSTAPSTPAQSAPASADASTQAPTEATSESQQQQAQEWRRKVKVDGREVEVGEAEIPPWLRDAVGEEEALSTYRLRAAAQARMKEAAELRKRTEAELGELKSPDKMMSKLIALYGSQDAVDAAIEAHYRSRLQLEQMSPEQRQMYDMRQENERLRREAQVRQEQERETRLSVETQRQLERFRKEIPEAIKANGLPLHQVTVKRLAGLMKEAHSAGYQMNAAEAAAALRAEMREEWSALHGSASDDELFGLVGEERINRLQQKRVEQLKATAAQSLPAATPPRDHVGRFTKTANQPPASLRDFFRNRRG